MPGRRWAVSPVPPALVHAVVRRAQEGRRWTRGATGSGLVVDGSPGVLGLFGAGLRNRGGRKCLVVLPDVAPVEGVDGPVAGEHIRSEQIRIQTGNPSVELGARARPHE